MKEKFNIINSSKKTILNDLSNLKLKRGEVLSIWTSSSDETLSLFGAYKSIRTAILDTKNHSHELTELVLIEISADINFTGWQL